MEAFGEGLSGSPNVWTISFSWISPSTKKLIPCSHPDHRPNIGKKSLIAFRQILLNIFSAAWRTIYSRNHDLFKKVSWNQILSMNYAPGIPKMKPTLMLLCCAQQVWPSFLPLNFYGKPWGWGRIPPNREKFTHFPYQKKHP